MSVNKKISSLKELPTVRQLRAFAAVARAGNVRGAAELLSLTQPAVTVLLRELETKLGLSLFVRTSRGLRLTEVGKEGLVYAERVLYDLSRMVVDAAAYASAKRGTLKVAATSTVAQTLVPGLVKGFVDEHPSVHVVIDDCSPDQFAELIDTERVHLGIGTVETRDAGFDVSVFATDDLVAVGTDQVALGNRRPISWKMLSRKSLIVVRSGYGVRKNIDVAAETAGVDLDIKFEVALMSTAIALAAKGLGIALVPKSVLAEGPYPGLLFRKVHDPIVTRELAIVTKTGVELTPLAHAFADFVMRFKV